MNNQEKITDILKNEGVDSRGYGKMPYLVLLDPLLTPEAWLIYAYLKTHTGSGFTAFPSREKILKNLKISKDTFYEHFNILTALGYVKVKRNKVRGKNIYILPSSPERATAVWEGNYDLEEEVEKSGIRLSGIERFGYGSIGRLVLEDDRLTKRAKIIYIFLAVTANAQVCSEKRQEKLFKKNILNFLGISESTYNEHLSLLIKYNYITVTQMKDNKTGRFLSQIFDININPIKNIGEDNLKNKRFRLVEGHVIKVPYPEKKESSITPYYENKESSKKPGIEPNLPYPEKKESSKKSSIEPNLPYPEKKESSEPYPEKKDTKKSFKSLKEDEEKKPSTNNADLRNKLGQAVNNITEDIVTTEVEKRLIPIIRTALTKIIIDSSSENAVVIEKLAEHAMTDGSEVAPCLVPMVKSFLKTKKPTSDVRTLMPYIKACLINYAFEYKLLDILPEAEKTKPYKSKKKTQKSSSRMVKRGNKNWEGVE